MKLFFKDQHVGDVFDATVEGVWVVGRIKLSVNSDLFRDFFSYITDENLNFENDPPFEKDLLDEKYWIILENGDHKGISLPAVHKDGVIEWRWR